MVRSYVESVNLNDNWRKKKAQFLENFCKSDFFAFKYIFMKAYLANADQIRRADQLQIQQYDYPGLILMEHAGRKAAVSIVDQYPDAQLFIILAGPGNNGGDGFVIARYLTIWGKEVHVFCSHDTDRYTADAATNLKIIQKLDIPISPFSESLAFELEGRYGKKIVLIDALLGTGISGPLRGSVQEMIDFYRLKDYAVVAIDIPSGMDSDTGHLTNEVLTAELTITFQLHKICHLVHPAAEYCGKTEVLDIGLYPQVIEQLNIKREVLTSRFIQANIKTRASNTHKGQYGHVLMIGGSRQMAGAIALSAHACMHAGAGLCTVITPLSAQFAVNSLSPETMCIGIGEQEDTYLSLHALEQIQQHLPQKSVVCIGPGMGTKDETRELLLAILPLIEAPLILDADALNILAEADETIWSQLPQPTIITPHPGEMRRLYPEGKVISERLETAEYFAKKHGVMTVLKGAGTIVALPDGKSFVNTSGNAGMSTAGAGDVLTGIITALVSQGYDASVAAAMGVFLHGAAGDKVAWEHGQEGVIALLISEKIGKTMKAMKNG